MYGDSKAITSNKQREKNLNVTKQPCHARGQQRAAITFITKKTKNAVGEQMLRKPIFV